MDDVHSAVTEALSELEAIRSNGAGVALVATPGQVADELDQPIAHIQTAGLAHEKQPLRTSVSLHNYRAWSEQEHKWVSLTFNEHQAWLARPDLDAVEFTDGSE